MRNIRLAREQVVDSEVVALTGARKPYLHALLEIAAAPRAMPLPAPLFLVESQLARRVALLVKEFRVSKLTLIGSLAIALAVLVAAGCWAVKTFWLIAPARSQSAVITGRVEESYNAAGGYTTTIQTKDAKVYGEGHPYSPVPIYKAGEDDVSFPMPMHKPEPPYAPQARKDKVQGTVRLQATVDVSGNVVGVELLKGVGDGLDENAIEAVRTWKFHPALKKGYPVPAKVTVEVYFRLF
jgi:TonB family protein